jgi:diguanylate cyclase (GGDEF)-like protein/PAS domain S-box-containing protein
VSLAQSVKSVAALAERSELERFKVAVESVGDAVYDWTSANDEIVWSGPVDEVVGHGAGTQIKSGRDYLKGISEEGRASRDRELRQAILSQTGFTVEYKYDFGTGEASWLEERGTCFLDETGALARIVGVVRDITERKKREARLTFLATYDELTGHLNRSRLCASLSEALTQAHRHHRPGAYVVIGIDGLALINESHGYDIADELIQMVGERISFALRKHDLMGRVAGNKFGVVLPNAGRDDMELVASRLLEAVRSEPFQTSAGKTIATISIGCVELDEGVKSSQEAMSRAEEALDSAKRNGRDCYVVHHASPAKVSWRRRNRAVADSIVSALSEERMKLAFQPIVHTETGETAMYECLIRMEKPGGEIASAGEFIPVAEQLGLVRLIDQRVQELVIREARRSPDTIFTFNVSGYTASDTPWMRKFLEVMEENQDIAHQLVIELTETVALREVEESVSFLKALRGLGCRVAIDDFGAGYTSFRNLQALEVDIVKIDGAFVRDLASSADNRMFVKTLVELAKNFGVEVIAEWVETDAEVKILREYGVEYLQGFLFGAGKMETPWRD